MYVLIVLYTQALYSYIIHSTHIFTVDIKKFCAEHKIIMPEKKHSCIRGSRISLECQT
jgi:hypothetical protein